MTGGPALAPTRSELRRLLAPARGSGAPVALVPTMGALHDGHASLLRAARRQVGDDGCVVASIFVNPLQFAAGEDLDRYPRTADTDLLLCGREGVDVVFEPAVEEVYPGGQPQVTVDPGPLATVLEGRVRPDHFRGVLTVVAKLFGLVRPDVALFGQKDYQQLVLVRRMAADLCLDVEVVGIDTCRERDGLALSSRNAYLGPHHRRRAAALHRALAAASAAAGGGVAAALRAAGAALDEAGIVPDYLEITTPDLERLEDPTPPGTAGRVLVAARLGGTRLIDNLPLTLGTVDPGRGHG